MALVRLEPTAPRSRVKHSTTEPLRSLMFVWARNNISTFHQSRISRNSVASFWHRFSWLCKEYVSEFTNLSCVLWITNGWLECVPETKLLRTYSMPKQKRRIYGFNTLCVIWELKISSAIYVLLLFLPHIIPIVLLSSVNPNQCTGWFFIFQLAHVHSFYLD